MVATGHILHKSQAMEVYSNNNVPPLQNNTHNYTLLVLEVLGIAAGTILPKLLALEVFSDDDTSA